MLQYPHLDRNNRKFYKILSHNGLPEEKKKKEKGKSEHPDGK